MKRVAFLAFCFCVGIVVLVFCLMRTTESVDGSCRACEFDMSRRIDPRVIGGAELRAKVVECSNAVEMLRKGDVAEFAARMNELRRSVSSLNSGQLGKVTEPLSEFVFVECLRDDANLDFADVKCFRRYVETLCAAVLQLGEVDLAGMPLPVPEVGFCEALVWKRLRLCEMNARKVLRDDVAEAAKRECDRWGEQIESKDGLTRRYAMSALERESELRRPSSVHAWWNLIKGARSAMHDLLMAGFVPKWIDADFGYDRLLAEVDRTKLDSDCDFIRTSADGLRAVCEKDRHSLQGTGFETCDDFRAYVRYLKNAVLQKGEMLLKESPIEHSEVCGLEVGLLELLWKYRILFAVQRRQDCADAAQEALSCWKDHIDSQSGLIRRWVEAASKTEIVDRDADSALNEVRLQIYRLVLSGFTPSWAQHH